jgi:hypothetical protein
MEYFDAAEEMHTAIQMYVDEHGTYPHRVYVSRELYQWLIEIRREELLLHGENEMEHCLNCIATEYGDLQLAVDESLTNFQIVPE